MLVLGIESSCDETGVALYDGDRGLLAHALHSQVAMHAEYGGVVPELASRDHVRKVLPLTRQVMDEAGVSRKDIDGIAYTAGPGLIGALLVGAAVGRSMAFALGIPAIGVHHMEGHLLAPMLEAEPPEFPFVALLVSGGHTQLVQVEGVGKYSLMGQSLDDAAGEAFDKTAKLLDLGYPGGPALSKLAQQGDASRFNFPRPMTDRPGLDFSFSGLKTFALNTYHDHKDEAGIKENISAAFEKAVVETMVIKCRRALEASGMKRLVIAGGVSANQHLRQRLGEMAEQRGAKLYYPRPELCTDNGAMIAYAGYLRLKAGQQEGDGFTARPRWPMEELTPID